MGLEKDIRKDLFIVTDKLEKKTKGRMTNLRGKIRLYITLLSLKYAQPSATMN